MEGQIFSIQRFSTDDGPGIRTTVFLKGCPLRCLWCHNPEGLSRNPNLIWLEIRCIECGECIIVCPQGAITKENNRFRTDRSKCKTCGKCVEVCPSKAREILGRSISANDLIREVEKDRIFFDHSKGGVTLSGGEPCIQSSFVVEFLELCRSHKIHTAVDTSGCCPSEDLEKIVQKADMILFDLKVFDETKHQEVTSVNNSLIFQNLRQVLRAQKRMWIRIPVIPGYTDDTDNIKNLAKLVKDDGTIERIELLPYHKLAEDKYRRLDKEYKLNGLISPSHERMEEIANILIGEGVKAELRY